MTIDRSGIVRDAIQRCPVRGGRKSMNTHILRSTINEIECLDDFADGKLTSREFYA